MRKSLALLSASLLATTLFLTTLCAQTTRPPDAYSLSENYSLMMAGQKIKIDKDGSKVRYDNWLPPTKDTPKPTHVIAIYDLRAGTNTTWQPDEPGTACGNGTFSGDWGDPYAASEEMTADLPSQKPKVIGKDMISGMATRVMEVIDRSGKGRTKIWIDETTGLIMKIEMIPTQGQARTMIEVTRFSLTKPAASLFVVPAYCGKATANAVPNTPSTRGRTEPPAPPRAEPPATSGGARSEKDLPAMLPVPPGVTWTGKVQYKEFGQDDFTHTPARGATVHITVSGHYWYGFLKGDATSITVASWTSALEKAGWQVVGPKYGNIVAKRGDVWAKIGLDRVSMVEKVEAEAMTLIPPGDKVETLEPDQDAPYASPLPGTVRKEWKKIDRIEVKGDKDPTMRMFGPAVSIRYQGTQSLNGLEIQTRYNAALSKAGWDVVRSNVSGITDAHYTQHGRDIWMQVTPIGSSYVIAIVDMGAAAEQSKLAKAIENEGHVALYGIYFDTDKATLRPDSEATLLQVQKLLASHPAMKLEIQGHTDSTGNRPHNQTLSQDRANSVKAWLVAHQINGARLTTKGYADTKPVADNNTEQGRALNRRVELARP